MSASNAPDKVLKALELIGTDVRLRERFVDFCREIESKIVLDGRSVRDEVTGPIVDALHSNVGVLRKNLSTGFTFDFHYRSKIAREFVMSFPSEPNHVWEPQTTKLLVLLAAKAKHALVGGAYFGDQALLMARKMGAGGTVHAFELNGDQAAMLAHNAQVNGIRNVVVNQYGLWRDEETQLDLVGDDSFAHPAEGVGGASRAANTVTIDGYLERNRVEQLDLIMLDIEGGELPALEGALRQLARPKGQAPDLVFEVHRSYVDWSKGLHNTPIVQLVRSHGYEVFAVRDFQENRDMGTRPIELIPPERTYLEGPPHGFNLLAVKDRAKLDRAEFSFSQDVSPKLLMHKSPHLHHPKGGM